MLLPTSHSQSSKPLKKFLFPLDPIFHSIIVIKIKKMKQEIVIRVSMHCAKCRSKALKIGVGVSGVESAALTGQEKDQLKVVGDGIDSVELTRQLRKKVAHADLVSVSEVKKEQHAAPLKKEQHAAPPVVGFLPPPYCGFPPYPCNCEFGYPSYGNPCTIM